jgi:hypothetical protein
MVSIILEMILEMVMKMEDATEHTEVMDNLKEWTNLKSRKKPLWL